MMWMIFAAPIQASPFGCRRNVQTLLLLHTTGSFSFFYRHIVHHLVMRMTCFAVISKVKFSIQFWIYFILYGFGDFDLSIWTDFRTICVNFWMIEKLCSLTNCISPHLARPHFLHKYLIIEVLDLDVISSFWVCTCADCRFVHVVRRVVLTGFPCLFPFIIIFVHMHLVKCFCIDM